MTAPLPPGGRGVFTRRVQKQAGVSFHCIRRRRARYVENAVCGPRHTKIRKACLALSLPDRPFRSPAYRDKPHRWLRCMESDLPHVETTEIEPRNPQAEKRKTENECVQSVGEDRRAKRLRPAQVNARGAASPEFSRGGFPHPCTAGVLSLHHGMHRH